MSIRVLVVDDSALMRRMIELRLGAEPDIDVVGAASNAKEARVMIRELDPDVVTLDIEMPGMDGLSFLAKIMELRPTPVIIVSGSTQEGTLATARALALGAVSCYPKFDSGRSIEQGDDGKLVRLVREAAQVSFKGRAKAPTSPTRSTGVAKPKADLIAIGSSTGGVEALRTLLPGFPPDCPPVLIVQHINPRFASAIAESLDEVSRIRIVLAETDTVLKPGHAYLAPGGDRHLLLANSPTPPFRIVLRQGDPVSGHVPSVDMLFQSVARAGVKGALGILLTGMGQDGARGLLAMREAGARTIVQDEASCVVFGMPRAAIELGAADEIIPLTKIASAASEYAEAA